MGTVPDLNLYNTIIVTSGNGVTRLKNHLAGRNVVTVGEKTAELARRNGATATSLGENVATFLQRADQIKGTAFLCRGTHSRGNIVNTLTSRGIAAEEAILYDQIEQQPNAAALDLMSGKTPIVAPVFSPRTASLLAAHTITAPITVLAISQAATEAWSGPGKVHVAAHPDAKSMLQLVRATI